MAQINVAAEAVRLPVRPGQQPVLFNQGAGILYLGRDDSVSAESGFPIASGSGYEWPRDVPGEVWAVSDTTADVRIMIVG